MPPVAVHRKQAGLCQPPEMCTGSLRSDSRRKGKLVCAHGTPIDKSRQHRCPRRVPDQCRDFGDDGSFDHSFTVAVAGARQYHGRSIHGWEPG